MNGTGGHDQGHVQRDGEQGEVTSSRGFESSEAINLLAVLAEQWHYPSCEAPLLEYHVGVLGT
jgi:hypothetical protein